MSPSTVTLKSISRQGDTMTIDLMNHSEYYYLKLNFMKETIPSWLMISNSNHAHLDDILAPGAKIRFNFENNHVKSTLR